MQVLLIASGDFDCSIYDIVMLLLAYFIWIFEIKQKEFLEIGTQNSSNIPVCRWTSSLNTRDSAGRLGVRLGVPLPGVSREGVPVPGVPDPGVRITDLCFKLLRSGPRPGVVEPDIRPGVVEPGVAIRPGVVEPGVAKRPGVVDPEEG